LPQAVFIASRVSAAPTRAVNVHRRHHVRVAGDKIARQFSAIEREIEQYRSMIHNQAGLLQAQAPSAVSHGEAIENQKKKIDGMIFDAITTSQEIIRDLAKPIPVGE
jgi:hypothetical protein